MPVGHCARHPPWLDCTMGTRWYPCPPVGVLSALGDSSLRLVGIFCKCIASSSHFCQAVSCFRVMGLEGLYHSADSPSTWEMSTVTVSFQSIGLLEHTSSLSMRAIFADPHQGCIGCCLNISAHMFWFISFDPQYRQSRVFEGEAARGIGLSKG